MTAYILRLAGDNPSLVWNLPVDLTFKSHNAFGWPKMHFAVYGLDAFGKDVIQGYGFTHVPCTPGRCVLLSSVLEIIKCHKWPAGARFICEFMRLSATKSSSFPARQQCGGTLEDSLILPVLLQPSLWRIIQY